LIFLEQGFLFFLAKGYMAYKMAVGFVWVLESKFLHKLDVYMPPARPFIFAYCIETGGPFRENMIIMHAARTGDSRGAYRVLVRKLEGRRPLGRPRRRCENNTKMALRPCAHEATQKKLIGHANYQPVTSELLPL
jgi:hypothetical protein